MITNTIHLLDRTKVDERYVVDFCAALCDLTLDQLPIRECWYYAQDYIKNPHHFDSWNLDTVEYVVCFKCLKKLEDPLTVACLLDL